MKNIFQRGFLTLEMMIAFAILSLSLTAVILVVFGNQSVLVDSQTDAEALSKSQAALAQAEALARKDFALVNATTTSDGYYTTTIAITQQPDFFTKRVTATVSWFADHLKPESVSLSSLVTNFPDAVGGDTCNSDVTGDWSNPVTYTTSLGAGYTVSDVDAYKNRAYITMSATPAATNPTFYILNTTNAANPTVLGSIDNAASVSTGINAVAVATSSAQNYAYVANAYDANFTTCPPGPACSQLQVIDITNPAAPSVMVNYELATTSAPRVVASGGSQNAIGKAIFYKNGYVYLGLSYTGAPNHGPEFNIIDVHNPLVPFWVGSWPSSGVSSGYAVNAITVKGSYAYLATDNSSQDLVVLDVSDPTNPTFVTSYDAPGGAVPHGKSVAATASLSGSSEILYLGRIAGNAEFSLLNFAAPSTPTLLGGAAPGASVNGMVIRNTLAFLTTFSASAGGALMSYSISDSSTPALYHTTAISGTPVALDCEGNWLYVAHNNLGAYLTTITAH
jgi:hypothetical protein